MPPPRRLAAVALSLGVAVAWAGEMPSLGEVEVVAGPEGGLGVAGSATEGAVDSARIAARPLLRPGDVLETVPGVIVTQHSGDGKANQYFLRGFNLDHGTDFATRVNGMPVNMPSHAHGQGYADVNFIIPELVERVAYRKGPYAAEQGDFSSAGSADVDYHRVLPAPFLELTLGGNGYRRGLVAGSPELAGGHLLYGLEWLHHDGPWVVPENLARRNGVLRYAHGGRDNGWSVTAMAYDARWTATDQVPRRAVAAGLIDRYGSLDPTDGGNTRRHSLSADWARRDGSGHSRANAFLIDSALDLHSNFTYATDPVRGDQFLQTERRRVAGLNATRTWFTRLGGHSTDATLGVQMRQDRIDPVALMLTEARTPWATVRRDRVSQGSVGVWGELQTQWHEAFRSLLGLRGDGYRFDVASDRPDNSGVRSAQLVSPRAAFVFGPWRQTELYANLGHGFHSNDARGVTLRVNPDPRDPGYGGPAEAVRPLVRSRGTELGVRSTPAAALQTALAVWRLDMASELLFVGDAGTTEASRPSRRTGIEWSVLWAPWPWLTVDADVSVSRARFRDADPAGNRIPGAVERTLSLGATVDGRSDWYGSLRLRHVGPRALVEDDTARSAASTLVNLRLGHRLTPRMRLTLDVLNLFDRKVSDIDYYYVSRLAGEAAPVADVHTHPAQPRTLRLAWRWTY